MPGPRIASERLTPPSNLVQSFIGSVSCRALVDSGAAVSVLNEKIYRRMRKNACRVNQTTRHAELQSADSSSMHVLFDVETDVNIGGVTQPCTFSVVSHLEFDAIIGIDF